ncbi:hypothetical protein CEP52_016276 [Fusarium oligoseptatum]|uniref:Uncharacterized protein n=1 Tax=Fusarium oligoseptatum TaxID=2604345 RepID=A0A428S5I9_9HYPO|nr:hypothetical protein CEP52_016276 [Fusarium oligoseptatum]
MMQAMGPYWKLASLLEIYARCIYDIHQRNPPVITNEPKHADVSEFTSFKPAASLARPSILEFTGVLRSSEGGPGLQQATRPNGLQNLAERQQLDAAAIEWPTLDVSNSLFDAEMANFFPDTKSIDPSLLDAEPLAWNFLDVPAGEGD